MTLALVLLGVIFPACASVQRETDLPIEAWRIDPKDATLYRDSSPYQEDFMPIMGNKDVNRFTCFDAQDVEELIYRANR